MKLSKKQKEVIEQLRKYDPLIMADGWCTGGHGLKVDLRSVSALKSKGLIYHDRLTVLGHTINID